MLASSWGSLDLQPGAEHQLRGVGVCVLGGVCVGVCASVCVHLCRVNLALGLLFV